MDGATSVRNLVTIATPHHGTYTAYLGPGKSADQLKYNSPFIQALNANGYVYEPVQYTSIWSNIDEIVIPPRSAIMPESTVHQVRWTGHLSILFSRRTYTHVLAALRSWQLPYSPCHSVAYFLKMKANEGGVYGWTSKKYYL